jgi:ribosomal-protein-alanine N-acetyltransferase
MAAELRRASPADAATMARLAAGALPEAWPEAELAATLARRETRAWLAPPERGFVLGRVAADEAEILALAVETPARRRGIGRALVLALLEQLAGEGVRRVWLEVRGSNLAAQKLYAACGFAASGRRTRYYSDGEDALVLGASV